MDQSREDTRVFYIDRKRELQKSQPLERKTKSQKLNACMHEPFGFTKHINVTTLGQSKKVFLT